MSNKIVRTIHAHVSETVEIVWETGKVDESLRKRYTAPPVDTWQAIRDAEARAAQPLLEDEWTPGGNQGVGP